jgi:predicted RNA-binding protein
MNVKYWVGVASKEHVQRGVKGDFCQLCHGRQQPLKRMSKDDWIIYYSSKEKVDDDIPCQQFTAIGRIIGDDVYQYEMEPGFVPFRRDVKFLKSKDVPIRPLIEKLSFIKNKTSWGYAFRFGYLEIPHDDFKLIATEMVGPGLVIT